MIRVESPAPQTGDDLMERQIKAAGADVAPRVTPADIEAAIVSEHYFTARQGCEGANGLRGGEEGTYHHSLGLLTICVLVLRNGFTVVGTSACASPENFNADIGRKIAREKAVDQLWPLLGYALKEQLATAAAAPSAARGPTMQYRLEDIVDFSAHHEAHLMEYRVRLYMRDNGLYRIALSEDAVHSLQVRTVGAAAQKDALKSMALDVLNRDLAAGC